MHILCLLGNGWATSATETRQSGTKLDISLQLPSLAGWKDVIQLGNVSWLYKCSEAWRVGTRTRICMHISRVSCPWANKIKRVLMKLQLIWPTDMTHFLIGLQNMLGGVNLDILWRLMLNGVKFHYWKYIEKNRLCEWRRIYIFTVTTSPITVTVIKYGYMWHMFTRLLIYELHKCI